MTEPPIEDLLHEIDPNWRDTVKRLADEGATHEEIVAHFQAEGKRQIDSLLDTYNLLKGTPE